MSSKETRPGPYYQLDQIRHSQETKVQTPQKQFKRRPLCRRHRPQTSTFFIILIWFTIRLVVDAHWLELSWSQASSLSISLSLFLSTTIWFIQLEIRIWFPFLKFFSLLNMNSVFSRENLFFPFFFFYSFKRKDRVYIAGLNGFFFFRDDEYLVTCY